MPSAHARATVPISTRSPGEGPVRTLAVAFLVALACSLVVSVTAVVLKPRQEANRLQEKAASVAGITRALGLGVPRARLVTLATGAYADRDTGAVTRLPADKDPAKLGEREDVAVVFEVRDEAKLRLVILPVRGSAYQSTLKGYLALAADLNTVAALSFYEHGETPGLGARIEEDAWQALWPGKKIVDADGVIRIQVVKGAGKGEYEVDGISGATRTGRGINNMLLYWLGPQGYGPYLARLRAERAR